jgi:hypothetical protein
MAKKKTPTAPEKTPVSTQPQKSVINLKGTDEQREWMAKLSRKTHIPAATITRLALDMWGQANGGGRYPGVETDEA